MSPTQQAASFRAPQPRPMQGFTLLELMITMAIVVVTTVLAVPIVTNATRYFTIRGAVSSVTGAIQSTRYQAIFQGCPYQVVFTAAAGTYQVQGEPYSAATSQCAAAFANVCPAGLAACPAPLSGSGNTVPLGADTTLTFSPGGKVTGNGGALCPCVMTLSYVNRTATITVSSYGNINVQYTP